MGTRLQQLRFSRLRRRVATVYVKDDYDPRLRPLYPRLPYAEDYEGAIRHFFKNGKPRKGAKPIQVNVEALSEFGFDEDMINSIDEDIEAHRTAA